MMRGLDGARAVPHIAVHQAQKSLCVGVDRDHHMGEQAVYIAFADRAKPPAVARGGLELHLCRVLNRQHMASGRGRAGPFTPAVDDFIGGHTVIAEEPAGPLLAIAGTAQPLQADGFAHRHLFQDRGAAVIEALVSELSHRPVHGGSCCLVAAGEGLRGRQEIIRISLISERDVSID
jgi:hypothetical protein